MKAALLVIMVAALVAIVVAALAAVYGRAELTTVKTVATVSTVVWFAAGSSHQRRK